MFYDVFLVGRLPGVGGCPVDTGIPLHGNFRNSGALVKWRIYRPGVRWNFTFYSELF
jgi:hypothetical protein